MPKKFQGVNTKAAEARARKADKQSQEQERKAREAEDAYWQDDDKLAARKQQRKEQQEQKKLSQINKKKELDELYKSEMEAVSKTAKAPASSKVTRAQIDSMKQTDKVAEERSAQLKKKNITVQDESIEDNINKVVSLSLSDGASAEARTVEEAISVLGADEELDRHPERRLKASFKKFEQEYLPLLKAENPNMRMSQLRQALRKAWQKSPENPLNQKHTAYNAK